MTSICGTPNYMSPELMARLPYDPNKMETWALGVCLYKLLTGKFPFTGKNDDELSRAMMEKEIKYPSYLSGEAIDLISKMLSKDSFKRATTTEVVIDKWFLDLGYQKAVK